MSGSLEDYFVRFEKMPESSSKWKLTERDVRAMQKVDWCVTEKIHGAHFVFLTDGSDVLCCKRKDVLAPQDSFFNYQTVKDRHVESVLRLMEKIQDLYPSAVALLVYGELFGGEYPHPDVAACSGVQAVQTGVYYSPSIQFCVFDLAIVTEDGERSYLSFDESLSFLKEANITVAEPLFVGSYEDALSFDPVFPSTIPKALDLPPLPNENWAEGVVIKPMDALLVSGKGGPVRPILKNKHPRFVEDARYHQAQRWSKPPVLSPLEELRYEGLARCTPTRWDNAVSKLGRPSRRNGRAWNRVLALFVEDVLQEVEEECPTLWARLNSQEKQKLHNEMERTGRSFVPEG